MRYARAKYSDYMDALAYRIFVSDSIYNYLASGSYINTRYIDIIRPRPVDTRSGEEIALDVIARAGLKFEA